LPVPLPIPEVHSFFPGFLSNGAAKVNKALIFLPNAYSAETGDIAEVIFGTISFTFFDEIIKILPFFPSGFQI